MDLSVVLQGLFIFHLGLALLLWQSYCLLTRKEPEILRKAALTAVPSVLLGFLVTYLEVGWDPLWVSFTGFQLIMGSTYVLSSVLHDRMHT